MGKSTRIFGLIYSQPEIFLSVQRKILYQKASKYKKL